MSFELEAPLINILGMSRYDLPACTINNNTINNWKRVTEKLCLTHTEKNILMKQMKTSMGIVLTEQISSSGIILKFNRTILGKDFNNILRNFINTYKICKKCKCPELRDGNCNSCGFKISNKLDDDNKNTNDKKILTKQEKRAQKVKTQQLKDSKKENSDDDDDIETSIDVVTVNETNNAIQYLLLI